MALQIKMRKRQLEAFNQTDCVAMCTVRGMLGAHGTRSDGEITPTHMCELLQQVSLCKRQPKNCSHLIYVDIVRRSVCVERMFAKRTAVA